MRKFAQSFPLHAVSARYVLAAATLICAAAPAAFATVDDGQAEWAQPYDADARLAVPHSTTPLLSPQTVASTAAAIEQYRHIAAHGGWTTVPSTDAASGVALVGSCPHCGAGSSRPATSASRPASPVFDSYVEAACGAFRRATASHEPASSTGETLAALNVPVDERLRQLEVNLVRLTAFAGNLGDRYVIMNIPAATVETVENGEIVTHHAAGVGKIDRQSPVMQARALEINFRPVLDGSRIDHPQGSDPQDADGSGLSDGQTRSAFSTRPVRSCNPRRSTGIRWKRRTTGSARIRAAT